MAAYAGPAAAQPHSSTGEFSPVFACFYECKPGPTVRDVETWQEITNLMVVNMTSGIPDADLDTRFVNVVFLDGNQNILGASLDKFALNMSPEDLDEINVCRTLQANGLPLPQAGLVEFYTSETVKGGGGGVYGWVNNPDRKVLRHDR